MINHHLHLLKSCRRRTLDHYLRKTYTTQNNNNEPRTGDKVVVGMSGGVDSSVTALLLARKDYDLSAVFMRNWDARDETGTDKGCEWERDWEDVQRVCKKLDIPCKVIDLSREYWHRVFEPSLRQWEFGVTPNTDVWCNREIKFGALLQRLVGDATTNQRPWFATGHYARKLWSSSSTDKHPSSCHPRPRLVRPIDSLKDQTFYLSSISEEGLRRALFPLSELRKSDVRELAKKHQLHNAERPESMGICFIGEKTKFRKFLSSYITPKSGPIINQTNGKIVGTHAGLWNYTIGEGSRLSGMPTRMSVSHKDPERNTLYVVPGMNHEALYTDIIYVSDFVWIWKDSIPPEIDGTEGFKAHLMHRYRMSAVPCVVRRSQNGGIIVECDKPEHSVTPGQVAVLYNHDWCLGCGVINASSRSTRTFLHTEQRPPESKAIDGLEVESKPL